MIVAIDPGTVTGVAWVNFNTTTDFVGQHHHELSRTPELHTAQFTEHDFYAWIDDNAWHRIVHLQVEAFTITGATAKKTIVYDSLYLIGYLRYTAHKHQIPMAFSKPSDVMAAFPDPALKQAGWHTPGKGHANDAARHLAAFCVRSHLVSGKLFLL